METEGIIIDGGGVARGGKGGFDPVMTRTKKITVLTHATVSDKPLMDCITVPAPPWDEPETMIDRDLDGGDALERAQACAT